MAMVVVERINTLLLNLQGQLSPWQQLPVSMETRPLPWQQLPISIAIVTVDTFLPRPQSICQVYYEGTHVSVVALWYSGVGATGEDRLVGFPGLAVLHCHRPHPIRLHQHPVEVLTLLHTKSKFSNFKIQSYRQKTKQNSKPHKNKQKQSMYTRGIGLPLESFLYPGMH